ncbi:hypothetical protein P170DRAFT_471597 [Aspergillus steynii IBT 23096]|uniref:Zn(2)-C6 fungal-type domain-containing protein n=1 Tax=Aspergillus steynii IBT 23096 TaxID=1392250 RepID=A0A2I2GFK4_9EURO|nr:uncharacterized protein P170DRAFT_471597 [Aspergillus steynii IBT 23096]PLB51668.1 hypothetical protein P170DRAFT_471597 [Aspergillus steynii IBT 23096]
MFATLRDLDSQSMVATEASTVPPPYNRPPHIVCQWCRSKKLKCSGFSTKGCARCRASNAECVPVSRSSRNAAVKRNQRIRPTGQDLTSPPDNLVRESSHCSPPFDIHSPSSEKHPSDGIASCPPIAQLESLPDSDPDCLEHLPYELHHSMTQEFLPPLPINWNLDGNKSSPESITLASSRDVNDQPGTQNLEASWKSFTDSIGEECGPRSDTSPCQCIHHALEMLDDFCGQEYTPGPACLGDNGFMLQRLATLRSGVRKLESLTACFRCRGAQRPMTLFVLLSERLVNHLLLTLETPIPDPVSAGLFASSVLIRRESNGVWPCVTPSTAFENSTDYPVDDRDNIMTLSCGTNSLDVTAETSSLLTLLRLTTLQQLRIVLSKLWDRAQMEQWGGHLKTLRHQQNQLRAMDVAMKAQLTVEAN